MTVLKIRLPGVVCAFFLLGVSSLYAAAETSFDCNSPLHTRAGTIHGAEEASSNSCVWLGIPYAKPPVGEKRWKAPQATNFGREQYEATSWKPRCMQRGGMELVNSDPSGEMSEDCLYLNIWRPKKAGRFPVMVFFHGGAYSGGTGNTPMYWGDRLSARRDVVMVTINYRLGVFGFLAHPKLKREDPNGSTGNYGALDQLAALKWIQGNISAFGGDSGNVTIFGESAGAWSICNLMASKLGEGLFHRAIMQSGGCDAVASLEKGYDRSREIFESAGCAADDVTCARALPAKKLLGNGVPNALSLNHLPHVDGYFLKERPLETLRSGNFNKVPVISGSNVNEIDVTVMLFPSLYFASASSYETRMRDTIAAKLELSQEDADELLELYPLEEYDMTPRYAFAQLFSDVVIHCPTYTVASEIAQYVPKTFHYQFNFNNMNFGYFIGSMHSMELPFIFDTLDRPPVSMLYSNSIMSSAGPLVESTGAYWTRFAATGNPNMEGLPVWPRMSSEVPQSMTLSQKLVAEEVDSLEARCQFWDAYTNQHGWGLAVFLKNCPWLQNIIELSGNFY